MTKFKNNLFQIVDKILVSIHQALTLCKGANYISLFWEVMPLESLKLAKAQKDPGKEKVKVQISKEDQPGAVAMSGDPVSDLKH